MGSGDATIRCMRNNSTKSYRTNNLNLLLVAEMKSEEDGFKKKSVGQISLAQLNRAKK